MIIEGQRTTAVPSPITLLIGALVAGYFANGWLVDPVVIEGESLVLAQLLDYIYKALLWACAGTLVIGAVLAGMGKWASNWLALIGEVLFTVTFAAMAIDTFIETKSLGMYVIVFAILALMGSSSAAALWQSVNAAPPQAAHTDADPQ